MSKKRRNQPIKIISPEAFRQKLKLKHLSTKADFSKKYAGFEKSLKKQGLEVGKVREHSSKILGAGVITGALLLNSPASEKLLPIPKQITEVKGSKAVQVSKKELLVNSLEESLPQKTQPLSREEEKRLEIVLKDLTGVPAKATLEGEHLNTTYGNIGLEQHLRRYPGDTLNNHGTGYPLREGMAPGLGAWGYFAPSRDKLTPDLEETEKWYAVAQTLYLPDWGSRQPYLRDWYKHRKVLIVNTKNGNAVVAAIADSGPAAWTGKHYGGSPEVMISLGGERYTKGSVVFFFVDDPDNKMPLGPVNY